MNEGKTTIYFIRHGEVDNPDNLIYGRTIDVHLAQEGFLQIKKLAYTLEKRGVRPDVIYTSPLTRAIQSTEEIIKVFPNTPVIKKGDLQDTDEAVLAGKTLEWLKLVGGDEYTLPEFKDQVERPETIEQRIMGVIKEAIRANEGKTIFVVSHGDPLAFAIWRLINPEGELPTIGELNKGNYLKKGEAWKVVISSNNEVIENELISRDQQLTKGEREF